MTVQQTTEPAAIDFDPISPAVLHRLAALQRHYFRPVFFGLDELDLARPALFVGNHTRYGIMDVTLLVDQIYHQHGTLLRSLGDHSHGHVPLWRDVLKRGGMVLGTADNCDALMAAGESILVFPGGGREVMRRKDEQYTLIWKKRLGFVRQAIKHGYDIIPFASLGADECYTVLADANDILALPWLQPLLQRDDIQSLLRGGDVLPPVGFGLGPTLLPRPKCFSFGFGARIATRHLNGNIDDEALLWEIRNQVASCIHQQIEDLKAFRQQDRTDNWSWLRRKLAGDVSPPTARVTS